MIRFYDTILLPRRVGFASEYMILPFEGNILVTVRSALRNDLRVLIVCDCNDNQHERNCTMPNVNSIDENHAIQIAEIYEPAKTVHRMNPSNGIMEQMHIPALNLRSFLCHNGAIAIGGNLLASGGICR